MSLRIAIAGATGLVGGELLRIIEEQAPQTRLGLYASANSAGRRIAFAGTQLEVGDLADCDFSQYDAALFCIGDELSEKYVPIAIAAGCAVVDKSNAFRLKPGVPLVVAGVNDESVAATNRLVANPNCSTIILAHALAPLARHFGLARVWASTYQSVSGAGSGGVDALAEQASAIGDPHGLLARPEAAAGQFAFNVVPAIGRFDELGRCSEEAKLVEESRRILELPELPVIAHAVRVPVVVGHSISVTVELEAEAGQAHIESAWRESSDLAYLPEGLPAPLSAARHSKVEVGRLRNEPALDNGWSFFVSGDNLNLGAALNGWRILGLMQAADAVSGGGRSPAVVGER